MLSGSAILRAVLLLVALAGLAGLTRLYWSHDGGLPDTPPAPGPSAPRGGAARAEVPPQPAPAEPVRAAAPAPSPPPSPVAAAPEAPAPRPSASPSAPVPVAPEPSPAESPIAAAEENAGPRAVGLVDINAAPLAELNRLKGGGSIGRAIVQHRPYTSVDQLLSKRVLSRSVYQRIRDQVTVR